jgi:hypothetical protein
MEFIGIIIIAGVIALNIYIYYLFYNISVAYWMPEKTKEKWIDFVHNPVFLMSYPFFKYAAPIWIILVTLSLLLLGIKFVLGIN